jgi:hypothetical protein
VVLPCRRSARLRVAQLDQGIQMPTHPGRGDAQRITNLTCSNGTLEQKLNDRTPGLSVRVRCDADGGRRIGQRRSRNLRSYFHNTIVSEFGNPV